MSDDRERRSSEEMLRDVEAWLNDDQAKGDEHSPTSSERPSSEASNVRPRSPADRHCPTCGERTFTGFECMACVRARPPKHPKGMSWWLGPLPERPEIVTDHREATGVIVRDIGSAAGTLLALAGWVYLRARPGTVPSGWVIGVGLFILALVLGSRLFSFIEQLVQRYGEPLADRWRAVKADRLRRRGHRLRDALEVHGWDHRWAYLIHGVMYLALMVFIVGTGQ